MAPEKRPRLVEEDEELEVFEVESASSSLQQASRKKARTSYDEPEGQDLDGLSDEELFQEAASQYATLQRSKDMVENPAADNGIIETVTCTNFMCHSFLEIPLGPLINFIIGHNGSGKSAVLTAITICLGGKASATNRGQSLKSFIKEGEESVILLSQLDYAKCRRTSMLSVKIKNTGDSAYQQDAYGDSIIVERHFSRSGSSSFKLKSSTGRIISTRKGDLDDICDYFALQIDNPMNVLTQDMARQFLNNSSSNEKYKFFMKGTQLEHLDGDYLIVEHNLETIDQDAWKKTEDVKVFEERAEKARHLLSLSEKQDRLRERIDNLTNMLAWSQVEEQERILAEKTLGLDRTDQKIQVQQSKATSLSESFSQTEQTSEHAQRGVEDAKSASAPLLEAKEGVKSEHDRHKAEQLALHTEQRAIAEEIRAAKDRIKRIEKDIEDEHQRLSDADGGAHALRRTEIEEKRAHVAAAKTRLQEHEDELPALKDNRARASEDYEASKEPITRKKNDLQQAEERLSSLLKDRGQQQHSSSPNVQRLLGAIAKDDGFRQKPVGPLGTHIDNPLVRKLLIINQGIDQTILIAERQIAIDEMNSERLQNVRQCFSLSFKPGEGLRLAYGYGGGLSQSHQQAWRGNPRMKTDIEYQINARREVVQGLKAELNQLEQASREKQKHFVRCEQAIKKHQKDGTHLRIEMQQAENVVDELQDALDNDAIEEGRLDALREQLKEAKEEQSTHEGSYRDMVDAKDKNNDLLKSTRDQMAAMDVDIKEAEAKVLKSENKATKCANDRSAALRDMNAAIEKVDRMKLEREQAEREREEQFAEVNTFIAQASQICARVVVDEGETYTTLLRKYEKLRKDLAEANKRAGGTREDFAAAAKKAFDELNHALQEVQSIEELGQLLKQTLVNRKNRWRMFQKHITARARIQFMYLLSERGFRGQLLANHKTKQLDLKVEPDETMKQVKGRKTMTLSGGEKSFSTICLLLSLWDAMGAPIRCLDEFDVFMDPVNREISMGMMIKAARGSMGKQFILITPQSMGGVGSAADVKVVRMPDPQRGDKQTRLPFAPATSA
ncbi:structural maintenance of chromosomes protein 6, partial [Lecanoromycetidae sp. Uapishka_2]